MPKIWMTWALIFQAAEDEAEMSRQKSHNQQVVDQRFLGQNEESQ